MALTDNLVAHWKLDEASGTRADSHGSNHLTSVNNVGQAEGKLGNAASFVPASLQALTIADNPELSLGSDSDCTVAFWCWLNSTASTQAPFSFGDWDWPDGAFAIVVNTSGVPTFVLGNGSAAGTVAGDALSTGAWHFIVAWHDSANDLIGIQVDGGTPVTASWAGGTKDSAALRILGAYVAPSEDAPQDFGRWDGRLDSFSFWKRTLSPEERATLYNGGDGLEYPFSIGGETESGSATVAGMSTAAATGRRLRRVEASLAGDSTAEASAGGPGGTQNASATVAAIATLSAGAKRTWSILGAPAWLLSFPPSWGRPVELRARVATEGTRSLTGREYRRPLGRSLRCVMRWRACLNRAQAVRLRDELRDYQDEPVWAPAWPFATRGVDWPGPVTGAAIIAWRDDWSSWDMDPAKPEEWDWVAPLMRGKVDVQLPAVLAPETAEVDFTFVEDAGAEFALLPDAVAWRPGPALNDATTPPVFPLTIDWASDRQGGAPEVEVTRRNIGKAPRTRAAAFYPQSPALRLGGRVSLASRAEIATLLRWWLDIGANTGAHYVPSGASTVSLASNADADATELELEGASLLGDYRYLAIDRGDSVELVRITELDGNTATLAAPLTDAVDADTAVVSVVALARHSDDELELSFRSPEFASARLAWLEVPEEYIPGAGETRGTTLGADSLRAWLYKVTVDHAGSTDVYRYTSFERDLTADGETWAAVPMTHSEIAQSIRLDRDEITLDCRTLPWCSEFLPGQLTARVMLEISECDVSEAAGSNVAQRWSGEIVRVSFDGPFVRATARGPFSGFDRPVPRIAMQPGCNHAVFDALCGLALADWTFTAEHVSASGATVTLSTWARTGGLPTGWGFSGYFALGYLERANGRRYTVIDSTSLASGQITLTLDRTVDDWASGEAVSVVPGCDGRRETCMAYHATDNPTGKFNNFDHFGGFPFCPPKNPSFTAPKRTDSSYGKK